MNTTSDPVLAVAVRAARRAASVIIDASRDLRRLPTFSKEHGDIVAAADSEAESAIAATISAAFPEHAILTADSGEVKAGKPQSLYRWIVDPIDGSLNFVHGFPYFAVSVALAKNDDITHAVILDPAHDELFTAIRDKGAQRNGAAMSVSACTRSMQAGRLHHGTNRSTYPNHARAGPTGTRPPVPRSGRAGHRPEPERCERGAGAVGQL